MKHACVYSRRVAPAVHVSYTRVCACYNADIKRLLESNTDELSNVLQGLDGGFIPPGVGGDLLRDGPGVLPTGRNMHALVS